MTSSIREMNFRWQSDNSGAWNTNTKPLPFMTLNQGQSPSFNNTIPFGSAPSPAQYEQYNNANNGNNGNNGNNNFQSSFLSNMFEQFKSFISSMMGNPAFGGASNMQALNFDNRQNFPEQGPLSSHPAGMDDKQLAKGLLNNWDAFEDKNKPGFITQNSIREMANKPMSGRAGDDLNVSLAREILSRPDLNRQLDQHSRADQQDGMIDKGNIELVIWR